MAEGSTGGLGAGYEDGYEDNDWGSLAGLTGALRKACARRSIGCGGVMTLEHEVVVSGMGSVRYLLFWLCGECGESRGIDQRDWGMIEQSLGQSSISMREGNDRDLIRGASRSLNECATRLDTLGRRVNALKVGKSRTEWQGIQEVEREIARILLKMRMISSELGA